MTKNILVYSIIVTLILPLISITSVNSFDGDSNIQDAVYDYPYLYIADKEGLKIFNVDILGDTIREITLVGQYDCENIIDISINSGLYAYLAVQDYGLIALDISQKSNPSLYAQYNTGIGGNSGLASTGNTVILANSLDGFYLLSVYHDSVVKYGEYTTLGAECFDVLLDFEFIGGDLQDFVILTDYNDFKIINWTDSTNINEIGDVAGYSFRYNSMCWGSQGSTVCVASEMDGFAIIDVSTRTNPTIAYRSSSDSYSDVCVSSGSGRVDAILAKQSGFDIWDIRMPNSPTKIAEISVDGKSFSQVTLDNSHYVFAITKTGEIFVFDIFDPTNPVLLDFYRKPFPWFTIALVAIGILSVIIIVSFWVKQKKKTDIEKTDKLPQHEVKSMDTQSLETEQSSLKEQTLTNSEKEQAQKIFCWKCGSPNKEDTKFCISCGEELIRKNG